MKKRILVFLGVLILLAPNLIPPLTVFSDSDIGQDDHISYVSKMDEDTSDLSNNNDKINQETGNITDTTISNAKQSPIDDTKNEVIPSEQVETNIDTSAFAKRVEKNITNDANVSSSFMIDGQVNNANLSVTKDMNSHMLYGEHVLTDLFGNTTNDQLIYKLEGAVFSEAKTYDIKDASTGQVVATLYGEGDTFTITFNAAIETYNTLKISYRIPVQSTIPNILNQTGTIKVLSKDINTAVYNINITRDKPDIPAPDVDPADGPSFYGYDATAYPGGSWNSNRNFEFGGSVNGASWNPIENAKVRITITAEKDSNGNPYPIRFDDYRNASPAELGTWSIWTRTPKEGITNPSSKDDYTYTKEAWKSWTNYIIDYNDDHTQLLVDVSSVLNAPNKAITFEWMETGYVGMDIFKPETKDTINAGYSVELLGKSDNVVASRGTQGWYKPFLNSNADGYGYGASFRKLNSETNEPMSNISFDITRIKKADGSSSDTYVGRYTSDVNGIVNTNFNLNKNEIYEVKEVNGPIGYTFSGLELNESNLFTKDELTEDNIGTVYNIPGQTNKGKIKFDITKKLIGKALNVNDFNFELKDVDDPRIIQTKGNDADGQVNFDELIYTQTGTYHYTVNEISGNQTGITYDEHILKITVQVENHDGTLIATADYDGSQTFINYYRPLDGFINLTANKSLTGKPLTDGAFKFELKDKNTNAILQEKVNDASGKIYFDKLVYTQAGTYWYTISEVNDNQVGITYDTRVIEVMVTVEDHDGVLVATANYDQDQLFLNQFQIQAGTDTPTPVAISQKAQDDALPKTGEREGQLVTYFGISLFLSGLVYLGYRRKVK